MRDDFTKAVKEQLGKRVSFRCSNPECRRHTLGPQTQDSGSASIGVAAHITAAAAGGPRFAPDLAPEQRTSAENGVWLCQNCARLVDADEPGFAVGQLREWKELAELAAAAELRGLKLVPDEKALLHRLEADLPDLFAEMRNDFKDNPHCREFLLLDRRATYNSAGNETILVYHFNAHKDLRQKIRILENHGFVRDISYNDIPRFAVSEEIAEYLRSDA
jgi:hypothetical protein